MIALVLRWLVGGVERRETLAFLGAGGVTAYVNAHEADTTTATRRV